MELQDFSNGFLKIKRKETQINVPTKDKSSEIYIGESIIQTSFLIIKFKICVKNLTENYEH